MNGKEKAKKRAWNSWTDRDEPQVSARDSEQDHPDDLLTQLSNEIVENTPSSVTRDIKSSPTRTYRREDVPRLTR